MSVLLSGCNVSFVLSYNSSRTVRGTVIHVACRNTSSWVTCVNNPSASDAYSHVVYMAVLCIKDQVPGPCARYADFFANPGLFAGGSWKTDSEFTEYSLRKSRTVGTVC